MKLFWQATGLRSQSARGKVIFLMDQRPVGPIYLAGHPSLRGRVLFTNAEPGEPDAAFIERNDGPAADITALVNKGYLVRTRTDADTKEARTNDTTRRDSMMATGAQILSTDYPVNEPARWPGQLRRHAPRQNGRARQSRQCPCRTPGQAAAIVSLCRRKHASRDSASS